MCKILLQSLTKLSWGKMSCKNIFTFVNIVSNSILKIKDKDTFKMCSEDTRQNAVLYL